MIELRSINVSFGEQPVFRDYGADISLSQNTAVFGASGSGKTTLLRLLLGLQKADSGTIRGLDGIRIAAVFQEDRLLPWYTALENVALVSDVQTASDILTALGLGDALADRPAALSGGMKRRVAIARALAYHGDLLLLDEPFNGLDDETRTAVAERILMENKPIVIVTHSKEDAALLNVGAEIVLETRRGTNLESP